MVCYVPRAGPLSSAAPRNTARVEMLCTYELVRAGLDRHNAEIGWDGRAAIRNFRSSNAVTNTGKLGVL
jgi:hypothetical protein